RTPAPFPHAGRGRLRHACCAESPAGSIVRLGSAVRPIGAWKFGEEQHVDLDFPLLASAAELRNLHFEPQDEGLELELPNEATNDANGAGGFPG
ncbi:hypothetical protein ACWF94_32475, partial [Streptomyces sp. NPDC055078]